MDEKSKQEVEDLVLDEPDDDEDVCHHGVPFSEWCEVCDDEEDEDEFEDDEDED